MRLWHESLLRYLPDNQLKGQHRECCALRGKGWGRPHSTVNYVFDHPIEWLIAYHYRAMNEMMKRGYRVDPIWYKTNYRGKIIGFVSDESISSKTVGIRMLFSNYNRAPIYPEHDDQYLRECLDNLAKKGVIIPYEKVHSDNRW